jgi:hypothetical protein
VEGGCQEINRIETPGEDFHMLLMTLDPAYRELQKRLARAGSQSEIALAPRPGIPLEYWISMTSTLLYSIRTRILLH